MAPPITAALHGNDGDVRMPPTKGPERAASMPPLVGAHNIPARVVMRGRTQSLPSVRRRDPLPLQLGHLAGIPEDREERDHGRVLDDDDDDNGNDNGSFSRESGHLPPPLGSPSNICHQNNQQRPMSTHMGPKQRASWSASSSPSASPGPMMGAPRPLLPKPRGLLPPPGDDDDFLTKGTESDDDGEVEDDVDGRSDNDKGPAAKLSHYQRHRQVHMIAERKRRHDLNVMFETLAAATKLVDGDILHAAYLARSDVVPKVRRRDSKYKVLLDALRLLDMLTAAQDRLQRERQLLLQDIHQLGELCSSLHAHDVKSLPTTFHDPKLHDQ
jgi:hypothetical protein